MEGNLLVGIVAFPMLVALAMLFVPGRYVVVWRYAALTVAIVELVLVSWTYHLFSPYVKSQEFLAPWLMLSFGSFGMLKVDFHLKTDGLNLSLVLLSAIVFFVSILSSFEIKKYIKGYYLLFFLLMTSVFGCFLSHDFLLFFLFFEFMLLPMYFLVGIWGGERREYAAIKFFLYTLLGSVFILLVMIATYSSVQLPVDPNSSFRIPGGSHLAFLEKEWLQKGMTVHTLDFDYIFHPELYIKGSILDVTTKEQVFGWDVRTFLFALLVIGFGIKLPVVPLHTWLPDAHVEAPTAVSVVLAGILLKIGGYGIIKVAMALFPDLSEQYAVCIASFGVFSLLYGGMNAIAQSDLKKLIAYSSVAHMGYVMLGIGSFTEEGLNGAMFQMVSHGIISSLLFLLAGVLYERTHNRIISNYRGLATKMPYYTVFSVIGYFAALGLPTFSGFIAEICVYMGAFTSTTLGILPLWLVVLSLLGLLIGAAYCLWVIQRLFWGHFWVKPSLETYSLHDLTLREWCALLPLALLTILLGVFPNFLFDLLRSF